MRGESSERHLRRAQKDDDGGRGAFVGHVRRKGRVGRGGGDRLGVVLDLTVQMLSIFTCEERF